MRGMGTRVGHGADPGGYMWYGSGSRNASPGPGMPLRVQGCLTRDQGCLTRDQVFHKPVRNEARPCLYLHYEVTLLSSANNGVSLKVDRFQD